MVVAGLARLALLALLTAACAGGAADVSATSTGVATRAPSQGTEGINHPSVTGWPYVVLVSFDGFRPDYLDRFPTPSFDRLAEAGARAALIPAFPSLTFPAHYSIATGLYPEHHGIRRQPLLRPRARRRVRLPRPHGLAGRVVVGAASRSG